VVRSFVNDSNSALEIWIVFFKLFDYLVSNRAFKPAFPAIKKMNIFGDFFVIFEHSRAHRIFCVAEARVQAAKSELSTCLVKVIKKAKRVKSKPVSLS